MVFRTSLVGLQEVLVERAWKRKICTYECTRNISQSLEPQVESDGINVTKVERIVENKVNRLVFLESQKG